MHGKSVIELGFFKNEKTFESSLENTFWDEKFSRPITDSTRISQLQEKQLKSKDFRKISSLFLRVSKTNPTMFAMAV